MGIFRFKQFAVDDSGCGMKIGTDSVLLGAWCDVSGARNILDLGCGSGILALMCAQRNDAATITAIDIDDNACVAAKSNAYASPWASRVRVLRGDCMEYAPEEAPDLIIANPPYFDSGLISPDKIRACARHATGFGPMEVIRIAARLLSANGSVAMIAPACLNSDLIYEAEMRHLKLRRACMVSTAEGKEPTLGMWQFNRIDGPIKIENLALRSAGHFTQQYIFLTKEFYL